MKQISITRVSHTIHTHKGFDEKGCYGCPCKDACCRYGCDVDRESYDLIIENQAWIEEKIGKNISECFEKNWSGDSAYLGGNSLRSRVGPSGYCIFHVRKGIGCVLYGLFQEKKVNKRIIPSICRLFPLTWEDGVLCVYDELPGHVIPKTCNVKDPKNMTKKTLAETLKDEIDDILSIKKV